LETNVLGTGKSFHMRVRSGGGAYICGEGSALMYAIMGERGQPRTKPPRSVEEGVWRRPTVLNNTETYASVPSIINNGGAWYAGIGTEQSKGTKLVTIQGPVKRIGVAEVEMGFSLRSLIEEIYGGAREGYTSQGYTDGGVSAGPLSMDQLDVGIDFESLEEVGSQCSAPAGSLPSMSRVCAVDFARYLTSSIGTNHAPNARPAGSEQVACSRSSIRSETGTLHECRALIQGTSENIIDLSLCGLGQVAPMPLLGMMQGVPGGVRAHIRDGQCPTGTVSDASADDPAYRAESC
jgi:NADH-quinone oxidoreductase subunit F